MNRELHPEVVILGSRYDLTCDLVVSRLRQRGARYLRLNAEDFSSAVVELDPTEPELKVEVAGETFRITESSLRSVLFRRPTFQREYGRRKEDVESGLMRAHWGAFIRSLMVFEGARWLNHPAKTYHAEHKAVQLRCASVTGFDVPRTRIGNDSQSVQHVSCGEKQIAVKGLDAVLLRKGEEEIFGFTRIVDASTIDARAVQEAPVVFQEALQAKTDLRVTVVRERVFAVEILKGGAGIEGDWRCVSREAEFRPVGLPREVEDRCRRVVASLGLGFGAIDLAREDGRHYFLELNPTGEWAWLLESAGVPIDEAVVDELLEVK